MASYDPQSHMDLFGGLPDPGEAAVDPRDLADRKRDEAREGPPCADGASASRRKGPTDG